MLLRGCGCQGFNSFGVAAGNIWMGLHMNSRKSPAKMWLQSDKDLNLSKLLQLLYIK